MTSNIGSQVIQDMDDPSRIKKEISALLKGAFRPEFLNRLDEVVIFNKLGKKDLEKIVDIQMKELENRLSERGIKVSVSKKAREELAVAGYDPVYGARPLKRYVQKKIYDVIAMKLLRGEITDNSEVTIDLGPSKEFIVKRK
jgi:ATP-dependent Clp protease ATP-binding subunit ClpB